MNQIIAAWAALETRRKLAVALAVAAALLAMAAVWRLSVRDDYALLYAGLEPAIAGEVVAALEGRGIVHDVRGGTIYVSASVRDATRLALAAEGVPATGGVGYELLDEMSGFGTTAQMFDAAYWRAKEGELARTILASRGVRAARVHIAIPPRQPFARAAPVTASITITPAREAIDANQAEAIRYLVASAVSGLDTANVAVIDSANGMLLAAGDGRGATPNSEKAEQMEADLERLLAARVGPGKARVQVHIDADMDSQHITERVIDPSSRVAISTDLEERSDTSSGNGGGAVTVASNLPAGDADAGDRGSSSTSSETRERQNFEISETRRERVIQPGQIRRITAAVILDGITMIAPDGTRDWQPRSDEEMTALRELVETAIGFDPARGDRVTLQTLEFPAPPISGTEAVASDWALPGGSILSLIQTAVLALVALLLGLFVIRPLLTRPEQLPAPSILAGSVDLSGENGDPDAVSNDMPALSDPEQHKIRNLRQLVSDRRDESADVLRRWIEAPDPTEETA